MALVCGASQGIGRATALAFAAEGAHVSLCARNPAALKQLASEIEGQFAVKVYFQAVDVRDSSSLARFVEQTAATLGRLHICIANAGGPPAKDFLATTEEDWTAAFDLNLKSAAVLAKAAIPYMQQQKWGRIITLTSITVRQPQPQLVLSNAVRAGVLGLVRSLANEFGRDGITVNNVAPGYTATNRLLELSSRLAATTGESEDAVRQTWVEQIPAGRLGAPEEIADAIVWLASERAAFITGQTLLVDGGMYKGL